MQIKYFCPLWGNEHLPFKTFLQKAKDQGYDGIEMSFPFDEDEKKYLVDAIRESQLQLIGQHWETVDRAFDDHRTNYETRLRNLTGLSPLFVNSQTGKDYYTPDKNDELIALAGSIAKSTGVKIIHETHRGKFAFAAHVTQQYIDRHPDLELCLDISHWCCVSETLLEDQHEAVSAALSRTHHLHARVGHTQGPQIMDPSANENRDILERHLAWWQQVVDRRRADGQDIFTITTEFGAPPYLPLMPHSRQPIYSQWDANVFMLKYLKANLL